MDARLLESESVDSENTSKSLFLDVRLVSPADLESELQGLPIEDANADLLFSQAISSQFLLCWRYLRINDSRDLPFD